MILLFTLISLLMICILILFLVYLLIPRFFISFSISLIILCLLIIIVASFENEVIIICLLMMHVISLSLCSCPNEHRLQIRGFFIIILFSIVTFFSILFHLIITITFDAIFRLFVDSLRILFEVDLKISIAHHFVVESSFLVSLFIKHILLIRHLLGLHLLLAYFL